MSDRIPDINKFELEKLEQLFQITQKGNGAFVGFQSELGEDKTTLIHEFLRKYYQECLTTIVQCRDVDENKDYLPFKEILVNLNADAVTDTTAKKKVIASKLMEMMKEAGPDWIAVIPVIGNVVAAGVKTYQAAIKQFGKEPEKNNEKENNKKIQQYCEKELRRLAQQAPIVIFINNMQWIDSKSSNLLLELNQSLKKAPFRLLLIFNYRLQDLEDVRLNQFTTLIKLLTHDEKKAISLVEPQKRVARPQPEEKPPNAALPQTAKQFPVPPPVLNPLGREHDIEEVFNALKIGTSVAITGIAGVGKTTILAFAIHNIAVMNNSPYTDICFHRIAERDSEGERLNRLLLSLITHLDPQATVDSKDPESRFSQARKLMAGRRVLLAIDNADDEESQDFVIRVRRNLPELTIAVTSRRSSSVWKDFLPKPVEGISRVEGVNLFKAVYGNHIEDEQIISLICQKVHGHPMMITHLALEAQENRLSLKVLYKKLGSFNVDRDLARRFDSVRSRLPESCHRVLNVIGLMDTATLRVDLVSEVTLASVADLKLIEDQHLIRFHPDGSRFTVHELIRTWCRRRLEEDGQQQNVILELRTQIANFYVQYFKNNPLEEPGDLAEIDDEWPNILGLIDKLSSPRLILELIDETIGDHLDDPNGYIPRRRQMASIINEPLSKPRSILLLQYANEVGGLLAARVEKNLGQFYYWNGIHEKAEPLFLQARDRYDAEKDIVGKVATIWLLGYLADDENRYQDAQKLYELGTNLAEQFTPYNRELVANGHHLIACTLYHQGRFDEAEAEWYRARQLIEKKPPLHLLARIDRRLGSVALALGRLDEAEKRFSEVSESIMQIERPRDAARVARQLALLHLQRNELEQAEILIESALKGFTEINALRGRGYTLHAKAILRRKQGRLSEAKELCQKSLDIAKEAGSLYGEATALEEFANILETEDVSSDEINRHRQHACNIYTIISHQRGHELSKFLKNIDAQPPPLPQNIKGVMFDLMDTLVYLEDGVYEGTQRKLARELEISFERFKLAWTSSRINASTGLFKTTEQRINWITKELGISIPKETLENMASEIETMWKDNVQLYDETVPLLEHLHKNGFRIAVVSNGPTAMESLKDKLGLSTLVDAFTLSHQVGILKPNPRIYNITLRHLGLKPSECIFVGDGNDHELDGAREVGLYCIRIRRTRPPYSNIKNESLDWDREINNIKELEALLQRKQ